MLGPPTWITTPGSPIGDAVTVGVPGDPVLPGVEPDVGTGDPISGHHRQAHHRRRTRPGRGPG
jgi:hypothetical protein